MSEKYIPKKGDRVRVVLEGEVAQAYSDGDFGIELVEHYRTDFPHEADISVEKIEPPVEVFKEGDRLRRKGLGSDYELTLGKRGYLHHSTNSWSEFGATDRQFFNSRNFELVYRP